MSYTFPPDVSFQAKFVDIVLHDEKRSILTGGFMTKARLLFVMFVVVVVLAAIMAHARLQRQNGPLAYVDNRWPTVVCLGDSLTAGETAPPSESYPAWLQRRIEQAGYHYRVINAGISGNRVADGLARLQSDVLSFHPQAVIVELGSNDPGHTPPQQWEAGLEAIVRRIQAHRARVILGGLDEPGMGDIYRTVAARYHIPLVWFVTQVAQHPEDWGDPHHPNGAGYRLVMEAFWPAIEPLLHH